MSYAYLTFNYPCTTVVLKPSYKSLQQIEQENSIPKRKNTLKWLELAFVSLAYQGKDIVFRFIIEYCSLRDFGQK
jgi:hypothetical protein